jgi:hypothetical protein
MNWFHKAFPVFILFWGLSLYSNELDDLESSLDKMLNDLNFDEAIIPPPTSRTEASRSVTGSPEQGFPDINLPPVVESGLEMPKKNHEAVQRLIRLEARADDLLKRLYPTADLSLPMPDDMQMIPPSSLALVELGTIQSEPANSFALPEGIMEEDFQPPPLPKNRFNFYLGFSIPNDSTYSDSNGNRVIEFGNGFEMGIEYKRIFEDESYIGAFLEGKFFGSKSLSGTAINGDNRLINFGFTLGQDWSLSEHFTVKTQASIGASSAHYEINSENYSSTDLAFHYSFLLGLEVKWNEYWQTSLYYELDGRSSADRMDYQSFHQIGIETGVGF